MTVSEQAQQAEGGAPEALQIPGYRARYRPRDGAILSTAREGQEPRVLVPQRARRTLTVLVIDAAGGRSCRTVPQLAALALGAEAPSGCGPTLRIIDPERPPTPENIGWDAGREAPVPLAAPPRD